MPLLVELSLSPAEAANPDALRRAALLKAAIDPQKHHVELRIKRRSTDARSRRPLIVMSVEDFVDEAIPEVELLRKQLRSATASSPRVAIVGAGPAGYFAALELLRYGVKPIVLDRGKDV